MTEATYRERWKREVYRTPLITDSVRVALLALADDMDDEGMVAIKQRDLAAVIGRGYKRAGERMRSAVDAGFVEQVSRGQRNGPGRYRATLPGDPSSGHPGGTKSLGVFVPPGGDEEDSLHPDLQGEENGFHQDPRGGRRSSFDPSVIRTPGGDEEMAPLYKDRAHAHSKGDPRSTTAAAEDDVSRPGGVVVPLFNEEIAPSLRSNTADLRSAARVNPDRFDEFWTAYPRRVAKGAARKAWDKAIKNGADPEEIIWGAKRYTSDPRRSTADIRYTAHPATWLNSERWTDEDDPAPAPLAADPRQQATNDLFDRALQRARALDAMEAQGEP